jgi:hypothetical protein
MKEWAEFAQWILGTAAVSLVTGFWFGSVKGYAWGQADLRMGQSKPARRIAQRRAR